jgi:hypothetical protein
MEAVLATLPIEITRAIGPLMEELPLPQAMPDLVPGATASKEAHRLAAKAVEALNDPTLHAGIWLYVDDLDRSHTISQSIHTPAGSFWHAIMHRREGDFGNSKYWLRQTRSHPIWEETEGYDPERFVGEVAARYRENPAELVEMQRKEWWALFSWCATRAMGA